MNGPALDQALTSEGHVEEDCTRGGEEGHDGPTVARIGRAGPSSVSVVQRVRPLRQLSKRGINAHLQGCDPIGQSGRIGDVFPHLLLQAL